MPCTPKKTFEVALATHNHLLVQLKDNQPSLLEAVETLAAVTAPIDTAHDRRQGVGRVRRNAPPKSSPLARLWLEPAGPTSSKP